MALNKKHKVPKTISRLAKDELKKSVREGTVMELLWGVDEYNEAERLPPKEAPINTDKSEDDNDDDMSTMKWHSKLVARANNVFDHKLKIQQDMQDAISSLITSTGPEKRYISLSTASMATPGYNYIRNLLITKTFSNEESDKKSTGAQVTSDLVTDLDSSMDALVFREVSLSRSLYSLVIVAIETICLESIIGSGQVPEKGVYEDNVSRCGGQSLSHE